MEQDLSKLTIGEVLKPQGIRGELKIKTFTDFPEDVRDFKTVYIDGVPYKILSFRAGEKDSAYCSLRGVPDRNAAELLRGKLIFGDRSNAPELEDGRYYIADLIGLDCVSESGEFLGRIKDIQSYAQEIYTLEKNGKDLLFPVVKGVIKEVDLSAKKMVLDKKVLDEISVN